MQSRFLWSAIAIALFAAPQWAEARAKAKGLPAFTRITEHESRVIGQLTTNPTFMTAAGRAYASLNRIDVKPISYGGVVFDGSGSLPTAFLRRRPAWVRNTGSAILGIGAAWLGVQGIELIVNGGDLTSLVGPAAFATSGFFIAAGDTVGKLNRAAQNYEIYSGLKALKAEGQLPRSLESLYQRLSD